MLPEADGGIYSDTDAYIQYRDFLRIFKYMASIPIRHFTLQISEILILLYNECIT